MVVFNVSKVPKSNPLHRTTVLVWSVKKPENSSSYSQLRATQDARDVLKHLGIEKAHIIGLSMGGFASLHFGLNFPKMGFPRIENFEYVINALILNPVGGNNIATL